MLSRRSSTVTGMIAVLVTADAGGDTVNHSYRHFANGALKTLAACVGERATGGTKVSGVVSLQKLRDGAEHRASQALAEIDAAASSRPPRCCG
jgi:hypothetical protein